MMQTLLVDVDNSFLYLLKETIEKKCPQVEIVAVVNALDDIIEPAKLYAPDLVIMDLQFPDTCAHQVLSNVAKLDAELIIATKNECFVREAVEFSVAGYLLKPIKIDELNSAIQHARKNLLAKEENKKNKQLIQKMLTQMHHNEPIGIPTLDGFDFFPVDDIIRCEGMQRCTRIVTKARSNIISSYNLGEFRRLLEPYGFFSPHKSHLINLSYIRHYKKEGIIIMIDGVGIPVSRNKKIDFVNQVTHL